MNAQTTDDVRAHFLRWSGGTPPDSPFEIFTYVELARLQDHDYEETRVFLTRWMEDEWRNPTEIENPGKRTTM